MPLTPSPGALVVGLAVCVLAWGARADDLARIAPELLALERVTLAGADGGERTLDAILPPGPAIAHFWATWCVPCRDELPAVDRFATALAEEGLADRLIVVSVDRSAYARVAAFLQRELGLSDLATWQDSSRTTGSVFRLFGYPSTVLLDAEHNLVARHPGALDWDGPGIRAELFRHLGISP